MTPIMDMLEGVKKKAYVGKGWTFAYEPGTRYVGASHPKGGKKSILEMKMGALSKEEETFVGHLIASLLNAEIDVSVRCPNCGATPHRDSGVLMQR